MQPGGYIPQRSLRVAVVDEELPFPLNTGKRIRTYNLLTRLARRHRILFLCHQNGCDDEFRTAKYRLQACGIECRIIDRKLPAQSVLSRGPVFYGKLALNLASPQPYLVDKQRSRAMQACIDATSRDEQFDLWHCEWTPYAQFFKRPADRPLVIDAHNVESLIWQRYYQIERHPLKRWYIKQQWTKLQRFERWAFARATRTVTVSDADKRLAEQDFHARSVDVVANGVDVGSYALDGTERSTKTLLFLGSLDWRPNLDGIIRFIDDALPAIRQAEPAIRLQIVGRKPPAWLIERIRGCPGVELIADVEDVRPYLAAAGVMVVPLRIGGGSRLKILEAAAAGLPVVSTRIGAEGLHLTAGQHYFAAETIEGLAVPVVDAVHDYVRALDMAAAARRQVQLHYDWEPLSCQLERTWYRALGEHSPQPCLSKLTPVHSA